MAEGLKCLRCGGRLEEGFVPEFNGYGRAQLMWVAGPPERSVWSGIRLGDKPRHRVDSLRCGRLESFATQPAA